MRIIDADALCKLARNHVDGTVDCNDIMRFPTVDAVPVVHGEWIIKPHGTYGQLRAFCSACGKHGGIGGIVSNQKKPYCPNCGAKMKGETDGRKEDY